MQTMQTRYLLANLKTTLQSVPKQNFLARLATSTLLVRSGLFSLSQFLTLLSLWSSLMGVQSLRRLMVSGADKTLMAWVRGLKSTVRVMIFFWSMTKQNTQTKVLNLDSSPAPSNCALPKSSAYLACTYLQHSVKYAFLPISWISSLACLLLHSLVLVRLDSMGTQMISLRTPSLTIWFYLSMEAIDLQVLPSFVLQTVRNWIVWPSSLDSVCRTVAELILSSACFMVESSFLKYGLLTWSSVGKYLNSSPMLKIEPLISTTRLYSGSQQTMYLEVVESFLNMSLQLILPLARVSCQDSITLASLRLSYFCFRQFTTKSRLPSRDESWIWLQPRQRSVPRLISDLVEPWVPTLMNSVSVDTPVMGLIWTLASQMWSLTLQKTLKLSCSSDFFTRVLMMTELLRRALQVVLTSLTACNSCSLLLISSVLTSLYSLISLTRPSLLSTLMFSFSISETSSLTGASTEQSSMLISTFSVIFLFSRTMMFLLTLSLARVICMGAVLLDFSSTSN